MWVLIHVWTGRMCSHLQTTRAFYKFLLVGSKLLVVDKLALQAMTTDATAVDNDPLHWTQAT